MICYARSCGTLLNRCLSSNTGLVVLSEVNPGGSGSGRQGSPRTPKAQAEDWYNIVIPDGLGFKESVVAINDAAIKSGRRLIVRDWTFCDFPDDGPDKQTNAFSTLQELDGIALPFAFVRNSIDIWVSRGCPPVNRFFAAYRNYVDHLLSNGIPIFKYEDFCENPKQVFEEICDTIEITSAEGILRLRSAEFVSGDVQFSSRGNLQSKVVRLRRKRISIAQRRELSTCAMVKEVNERLGYSGNYEDEKIESRFATLWQRVMNRTFR